MTSRIALVTGANQGIGFALVKRLCKEHPDWIVYGTARTDKNAEDAMAHLRKEGLNARFLKADITAEPSVIALKEHLLNEHGGLDVLVNNAGILLMRDQTRSYAEKVALTHATNVFGTVSVCTHLFPILRDGARVVILASMMGMLGLQSLKKVNPARYEEFIKVPPISLDKIMSYMRDFVSSAADGSYAQKGWPEDTYSGYCMSKTANILMARAYQAQCDLTPERDIVVNSVCPGYCATSMSDFRGHRTVEQGADSPYYLATLPPQTNIRGQHISECKVVPWL